MARQIRVELKARSAKRKEHENGSGALHAIKRLEKTAEEDANPARQLNQLKKQTLSSFES